MSGDLMMRLWRADVNPSSVTSWRDLTKEAADEIARLRQIIDNVVLGDESGDLDFVQWAVRKALEGK